jgi:hypothetical protein
VDRRRWRHQAEAKQYGESYPDLFHDPASSRWLSIDPDRLRL